jgi:prepilin-type N-terminal cleavage/methylation domain-containing protein
LKHPKLLRGQEGYTLVEIIAVLILISILASIAVPRYIDLEENAKQEAMDAAISELNSRESLSWAYQKISSTGYQDDIQLQSAVDYDLGVDYTWNPGHPVATGGTLNFKGESAALNRTPSDASHPAFWRR